MGQDSPKKPLVVLVGFRAGIMRAAEHLGVELAVINRRPPPSDFSKRLALSVECPWDGPPEALIGTVLRALDGREVTAVLALTEGAVLPAAHLRKALGAVGSDVATAERCSDKRVMKRAMMDAGIRCARHEEITPGTNAEQLVERLGLPLVMKNACSSGSRGLLIARSVDEVQGGLAEHDLAESFVRGTEMSVEGFLQDGVVRFVSTTRYLVPLHANIVPSGVSAAQIEELHALLQSACNALGLRHGMAHMEVFLTEEGPVFGELGARPPGGRLMPLIQAAWGFDPYGTILRLGLGRDVTFPAAPGQAAGTWILHPGAGVLNRIEGLEAAEATPLVRKVLLRVAEGDVISRRIGSGQDIGHIDVRGETPDEVADALRAARRALKLTVQPA
ncbi:Alanine-anticapsin ligase BacD [Planctomycetes bacterium Poly30]|uniref:Alanine-anticapsin ligase BacD n=1 Tax=Saltatorellus ferox TaxID=2528018 RepID=A0A518EM60_9BACT|nr:Alanine-anticapsin ligase BacD [Planctomycetes bacterium Poly30]